MRAQIALGSRTNPALATMEQRASIARISATLPLSRHVMMAVVVPIQISNSGRCLTARENLSKS